MKKLKFLSFAFLLMITSCNEDDSVDPTVMIDPADANALSQVLIIAKGACL